MAAVVGWLLQRLISKTKQKSDPSLQGTILHLLENVLLFFPVGPESAFEPSLNAAPHHRASEIWAYHAYRPACLGLLEKIRRMAKPYFGAWVATQFF